MDQRIMRLLEDPLELRKLMEVMTAKRPVDEPRVLIQIVDLSSSMSSVAHVMEEAQQTCRDRIAKEAPDTMVILLGVHGRVFQLLDELVFRVDELPILPARDFRSVECGGRLCGGSFLSGALEVGAKLALLLRRAGVSGSIVLNLISDGYNRAPLMAPTALRESELCARSLLKECREGKIPIRFFGATSSEYKPKTRAFIAAVRFRKEEYHVTYYEDDDRGDMDRTTTGLWKTAGEEVSQIFRRGLPPRPPELPS